MIDINTFVGQNWLITPAALAVNEPRPQNIHEQKWLLELSGIARTDVKGNSTAQWFHETLHILFFSALSHPLNHAINRYSIPKPPAADDGGVRFQLEQWTLFAAVSSIFNQNLSNNSGFAVDDWRIHPFETRTFDAFSGQLLGNIFNGIQVDVAVRDTDAILHRVSYNITLLGKIVFAKNVIF